MLAGAGPGCNCEGQRFIPAATYQPPRTLDLGNVSVTSEKTVPVTVYSSGGSPLHLRSVALTAGASSKWRIAVPGILGLGLGAGRTSSIAVTYRPCPEAWTAGTSTAPGRTLIPGFDFSRCASASDAARLTIVDDSPTGGAQIDLSGVPAQPPSLELLCQVDGSACGDPNATLVPCASLDFNEVAFGDTPCDRLVEVHDVWRQGRAVGDLEIDAIGIAVENLNTPDDQRVRLDGAAAGFTVRDKNGALFSPSPAHPLVISIPRGQMDASARVWIRFDGSGSGTWRGDPRTTMTGVVLYTSDPDHPTAGFGISGTGSAPNLEVAPPALSFGRVAQGQSRTLTATVTNTGDAVLRVTSLEFASDRSQSHFHVTTSKGAPPISLATLERVAIQVTYSPAGPGPDSDVLRIGNTDPRTRGTATIAVSGGPVPRIVVSPDETLEFPPAAAGEDAPRHGAVTITNVGVADLVLQGLQVVGMAGGTVDASGDFTIDECGANACTLARTLCTPSSPACTGSQTTFHLTYVNHAPNHVNFAALKIRSTDPLDLEHTLVLAAMDVACVPPAPVITVQTAAPCAGKPVALDASRSEARGTAGGSKLASLTWSWAYPDPGPVLASTTTATTVSFTPAVAGNYIVSLDAVNDCGGEATVESAVIAVAGSCP